MPTAYGRILVPFDGSDGASKALRRAVYLAEALGAEVTAFSVDEHVPRYAPAVGEIQEEKGLRDAEFAELRRRVGAVAKELGREIKMETRVGHAAQSIVAYAQEQNFDVIVMGQSGHSGVWGTLLGSTTARVVDHAPCDVLVVR